MTVGRHPFAEWPRETGDLAAYLRLADEFSRLFGVQATPAPKERWGKVLL